MPGPAELGDGLAHHRLRGATGVDLGVVEEVYPSLIGSLHALVGYVFTDLLAKGHPCAERESRDLQARTA